jgi:hypothetical protein
MRCGAAAALMPQASTADSTAPYATMSPMLLSEQPPTPRNRQAEQADFATIFAYLEARRTALRNWWLSWWAFWAVLAAFFLPFRYVWLVTANRMWRGSNINNQIINSHGLLALRTCAAGMWTGLCSPSRPWLKLGIDTLFKELDKDAQDWLTDTERKLYTVLYDSNFYTQMAQCFRDEACFGQAPVICYEDAEDVVRFYLPAAGEYYLGSGGRFITNTIVREFTQTTLQMVDFFRLENCPQEVQSMWQGGQYDTEFVVAHSIEPNFPIPRKGNDKGKIQVVPAIFPFREIYYLRNAKTAAPCSKRGFNEQPFAVFGWQQVSNDAYYRSPCMDAIGDNRQLQTEDVRKAEFIEKGVRPPMGADPELKNEPASIMPAMITYMNTSGQKKGFWPLFEVNPAWLTALTADITKIEGRIDHCLFVDLFMAISRMEGVQPRNELELTKRDLERLQELGPVVTLNEKAFDILIQRVLHIMARRGLLKPQPASLRGKPIKITYVSILRVAQRSAESVSMKDAMATGGQLSSASKAAGIPDPLRVVNWDKAYRHYLDLVGFPSDCNYTDDEVRAHDAIRHQEMQKAQMPAQAMAGVQAAKTLSETQLPGGNSALGAMLGGAGGAGGPGGAPA